MADNSWIPASPVRIIVPDGCLFGAKTLSKTMLAHCQLDPRDHISMKILKIKGSP